jgi:nucleoside triphosphate pyrophosphatase
VLASASPRRRELLQAIGLDFVVRPTDVDEELAGAGAPPMEAPVAVAVAKARAVPMRSRDVVLAADTMVFVDEEVLQKPVDADDARRMLARLRGRAHTVVTGVAVRAGDSEWTAAIDSEVRMRAYNDAEMDAYVAAGGGVDKAGSYGIQDEPFAPVEAIHGCYCNVMGLPLWTAYRLLDAAGCMAPRRPSDALARCAVCPMNT